MSGTSAASSADILVLVLARLDQLAAAVSELPAVLERKLEAAFSAWMANCIAVTAVGRTGKPAEAAAKDVSVGLPAEEHGRRRKLSDWCHSGAEQPPESYAENGPIHGTKKYLASLIHPDKLDDGRHVDEMAKCGMVWLKRVPAQGYRIWFGDAGDYKAALERKEEDDKRRQQQKNDAANQ
jgi:hypothetical protein